MMADAQVLSILQTLMSVSHKKSMSSTTRATEENNSDHDSENNYDDSALNDSEDEQDEDSIFFEKMNEWKTLYKPQDQQSGPMHFDKARTLSTKPQANTTHNLSDEGVNDESSRRSTELVKDKGNTL